MNVDENLTATDMNAVDMNAADMNAAEMNADAALNEAANATDNNQVAAIPTSLSGQPQAVVSYSTIEGAAQRFANALITKGITGARAVSEACHNDVQKQPTWDAADNCAAFDYAAAYVDEAVSRTGGFPPNGYFQFQRTNQADAYSAIGAPSYLTLTRLEKIRGAAESAAAEAYRTEVWRRDTLSKVRQQNSGTGVVPPQSAASTNLSD